MKMDPKQVHMAPFGLIFIQDGSHKLWEASGMPPGPQNAPGKSKSPGFPGFSIFSSIFLYFPIIPQQQHACHWWRYFRCGEAREGRLHW